jgi:hypothetical protein
MYKKIFGGIAVVAIAAVAAWNVNINMNTSNLSDVSLINIEALANNESGNTSGCYSTVHFNSDLGDNHKRRVKYCGSSCGYVDAHIYNGNC